MEKLKSVVRIALVGKYIGQNNNDAYASVIKALSHSAIHAQRKLEIEVRFLGLL